MKKRIYFVLLLFIVLFGLAGHSFIVKASESSDIINGKCGENVNFELNTSSGILRIYGSGEMWNGHKQMPWRQEYRKEGYQITTVKIEDGVTSVGDSAFSQMSNIKSVILSDTIIKIGDRAFYDCELSKLKIPDGVIEIGSGAFSSNPITELELPDSVQIIDGAFGSCNITKLKLPNGITEIGSGAFSSNPITELELPNSVQTIGDGAFEGLDIIKLKLPDSVQTIGFRAFEVNKNLKVVETPDGCEIGAYAFSECTALESVKIGRNSKIHERAFNECSFLNEINIGEGSEPSGGAILYKCTNLKSVLLPDNWSISGWDFVGCTSLENVQLSPNNDKYKLIDNVVYSKDGKTIVFYPQGLKNTEYKICEGVTEIHRSAFYGQQYLENIIIPKGVLKIRGAAFSDCKKLNNVIIPEGVEELLEGNQFRNCSSLKTIVLPTSLKSVNTDYKNSMCTFEDDILETIYGEQGSFAQQYSGKMFKETIYCMFDGNGGTGEETKIVIHNDKYRELPTPKRSGYTFLGWYTQKEAGDRVTSDTAVEAQESHTLYAHWSGGYDISQLTYNFDNSHRGFGYNYSYYIPLSSYKVIFNDTLAKYHYTYNGGQYWGGNCYGMASTSGMFNVNSNKIELTDWNPSALTVQDLKIKDMNSNLGLTLTQFIEAMQVSQFHTNVQKSYNINNDLNHLCKEVKNAENGGELVIIAVFGPEGGHALLGYKIEKVSSTESYLYVYDCNYPKANRYITLKTNNDGTYTGWYYYLNDSYDWGSDYRGCAISYVPYSVYYNVWETRAGAKKMNILNVNTDDFEIQDYDGKAVAVMDNGVFSTKESDIFQYRSTNIEKNKINLNYSRNSI